MKGIFKWMNSQVNYLTSTVMEFTSQVFFSEYVQEQYQTITTQASHIKQQLDQSSDFQEYADNLKKQAWLSLNIINNPELAKVIRKSKETRRYLNQLMIINGGLLAFVIINELFLKTVTGDAYENEQDSYLESALKLLSWCLVARLDFQFMFDKLAHILSAVFIVTRDFPNNKKHQDCKCILFNKVKCAPDKILDYAAMRGETYILMKCFGNYALFMEAMRIGMDLMSYKLDSTGKCVRHQREVLNANKVYCLMVGGIFLSLVNLFAWQAARVLNIHKDSLYFQIYSLLYPLFVLSMLTQKKAFINQKNGWDLFKYSRLVVKNVLKDIIALVNRILKNPNKGQTYEKLRAALAQSTIAANIKKILLPPDLQTLHLAVTRPAINEMVLLHRPGIKSTIKTLASINSIPGSSFIPPATDFIPAMMLSDTGAVLTKLLFDDNLNKLLAEVSSLIKEAKKHKKIMDRMKDIHKDFCTPSSSSTLKKNWVNLEKTNEEEKQQELEFILAGNALVEGKEKEVNADEVSPAQDQMNEYTRALALSTKSSSRFFKEEEKWVGAALEDKLQCKPINIEQ